MNVELFVHMDYGVYQFHDSTLDLFRLKLADDMTAWFSNGGKILLIKTKYLFYHNIVFLKAVKLFILNCMVNGE